MGTWHLLMCSAKRQRFQLLSLRTSSACFRIIKEKNKAMTFAMQMLITVHCIQRRFQCHAVGVRNFLRVGTCKHSSSTSWKKKWQCIISTVCCSCSCSLYCVNEPKKDKNSINQESSNILVAIKNKLNTMIPFVMTD